jgi:hypothetical protein
MLYERYAMLGGLLIKQWLLIINFCNESSRSLVKATKVMRTSVVLLAGAGWRLGSLAGDGTDSHTGGSGSAAEQACRRALNGSAFAKRVEARVKQAAQNVETISQNNARMGTETPEPFSVWCLWDGEKRLTLVPNASRVCRGKACSRNA